MISYRALAQNIQRRLGIRRFEEVLETLSVVLRSMAHELTGPEAGLLKRNLASELHQIVTAGRPAGRHRPRRILTAVADVQDVDTHEAQRRALAVVSELKAGASPWDEIEFTELLGGIERELASGE